MTRLSSRKIAISTQWPRIWIFTKRITWTRAVILWLPFSRFLSVRWLFSGLSGEWLWALSSSLSWLWRLRKFRGSWWERRRRILPRKAIISWSKSPIFWKGLSKSNFCKSKKGWLSTCLTVTAILSKLEKITMWQKKALWIWWCSLAFCLRYFVCLWGFGLSVKAHWRLGLWLPVFSFWTLSSLLCSFLSITKI